MNKIVFTLATTALAAASFGQTEIYNAFDSDLAGSTLGTLYGGSGTGANYGTYYGTTAGGFLADEINVSSLGELTNFDVVIGNAKSNAAISPTVTFYIWEANGTTSPGTEIGSFSASLGSIPKSSVGAYALTLNTPLDLTMGGAYTNDQLWVGYTSNVGYTTIGYGYAPTIGSAVTGGLDYTSSLSSAWNVVGAPSGAPGNYDFAVSLYTQAVPEPISMSLLGLGLVGIVARRRK